MITSYSFIVHLLKYCSMFMRRVNASDWQQLCLDTAENIKYTLFTYKKMNRPATSKATTKPISAADHSIDQRKPWKPTPRRFKDDTHALVRIEYGAKVLRERAKAAQGKWDPEAKAWYIEYGKIKGMELEKLIIL